MQAKLGMRMTLYSALAMGSRWIRETSTAGSRCKQGSIPVVSVHSTRRTCASLLVELDVHPRVAMQILRHSRITITMDIYSQVAAASTREALGRLGTALAIKS
jgi:integrase